MHNTPSELPVHPVTGLPALGIVGGRPVWPVLGGAPNEEGDGNDEQDASDDQGPDDDQGGDDEDESDPEGAEALGDAGKRALDATKQKWKSERQKRREAEAELEKLRNGTQGGDGDDAEAVRREAERAATAKANKRVVRSEVRAAAAGKLADPADALAHLDTDAFEVGEDGEVDGEEIAEAIDDLLKRKPYLAAQGRRFQGTAEGGARKGKSRPTQLTRDDLKRMSDEQIVKAKAEGRLDDALGIKR
ncbi:hypothetical protein [Nocardiopsis suaedae]|uniref:Scaffolding protein n=1 Tax=Nocardiopsis suaedae TaxID=3018444 RepID=A0ABT4TM77_9ACTN|nr:hypothetical protein [Nocardiopsis suaedae]MDA2805711.1 hypothetical protein [Nocardiopsis suaedae]